MNLEISGSYAAGLTLLFLVLSARVITYRRGNRISLGTGNDPVLEARVRAQGNFAEYAPLGIVLLAIAELKGSAAIWLHLCGALLLIGRLMHGVNFSLGLRKMVLRVGGMMMTLISLGLGAVLCLPT
jgi:uncharacterized protein